jgi:hypothetical protein
MHPLATALQASDRAGELESIMYTVQTGQRQCALKDLARRGCMAIRRDPRPYVLHTGILRPGCSVLAMTLRSARMALEDEGNHQLAAGCTMSGGACRTCFAHAGCGGP